MMVYHGYISVFIKTGSPLIRTKRPECNPKKIIL
jgi:hypothetical protein